MQRRESSPFFENQGAERVELELLEVQPLMTILVEAREKMVLFVGS